ncbi:MAG TPA: hypothetical protein DHV55_01665, partial [Clostridiaceae bacterium]|nr:hypothetical protein [Clostridiaceae bacterium]
DLKSIAAIQLSSQTVKALSASKQITDEDTINIEAYRKYFSNENEFEKFRLKLLNDKLIYSNSSEYKEYVERELRHVTLPLTVEYSFDNITIAASRPKGIPAHNQVGKIDIKLDNNTIYTIEDDLSYFWYWFTGGQPNIKPEAGLFYGQDKKPYIFLTYFLPGNQHYFPSKCYIFRLEDGMPVVICMLNEEKANISLAGDSYHIKSDFFNVDEHLKPAHPRGDLGKAEFEDAKLYELFDFDNDGHKEILYSNSINYNEKPILCYLFSMLHVNEKGSLEPLWTYLADDFDRLILIKIDRDGISKSELKANVEEFLSEDMDIKEFDTRLDNLIKKGIIYIDDSGLLRLKCH